MKVSVNINDYAVVQLTNYGRTVYKNHYQRFEDLTSPSNKVHTDYFMSRVDEKGMLKVPLWELINIFGRNMYMGENQLFENNIITIIDDTSSPRCGCGGC